MKNNIELRLTRETAFLHFVQRLAQNLKKRKYFIAPKLRSEDWIKSVNPQALEGL